MILTIKLLLSINTLLYYKIFIYKLFSIDKKLIIILNVFKS